MLAAVPGGDLLTAGNISLVISVAATLISIYALWMQRRQGHEVSTQTLIHNQYELCRVLDQLRVERPEVSHMLALPAQSGTEVWVALPECPG